MSLALVHGMQAMKPNVVLLSRNASSNTPSKIRLLLYLCVNIKMETATFPDNALHADKNIGFGSSPLYERVTRDLYDDATQDFGPKCAKPFREGKSGEFGFESI